jgi:protein-disulfide isomerase
METQTKSPARNEFHSGGSKLSIPIAIIIVGILIAGAIYFSSTVKPANTTTTKDNGIVVSATTLAPVEAGDRTLGNPKAKVTLVMYEDFQCIYCGAVANSPASLSLIKSLQQRDPSWAPFMPEVVNNYVKNGTVQLVYRDYAFLGPESIQSAEAARCAGDQGKFWEYHDYLFTHQNGENQGNFSDSNLKSFAKDLGLSTTDFNKCLDTNKYAQAVADSKTEGDKAGVTGTPKGFILRDGKLISTIDGAESLSAVKQKIDFALK